MTRFPCLKIEGGLIAADLIDGIADGGVEGQRKADFGLRDNQRLADEIATAWTAARDHWKAFMHRIERLSETEPGTTATRDQWVVPLLSLFDYELTYKPRAAEVEGRTYAVSHRAGSEEGAPPVHIVGCRHSLDRRAESGRPRMAPHSLVQEYLNRTEHLWGLVTNGFSLRLLRNSQRIARPTCIEFDLHQMMEGENYADFTLFYRLVHRSRLPKDAAAASQCLLEKYFTLTVEQGGRIRDRLRDGVEKALKMLANAFLQHPKNEALRAKVYGRNLGAVSFYRQLLHLIYRLLFLMVAEERNLLTDNDIYRRYYSISRLRQLAEKRHAHTEHSDLWFGLRTTFQLFQEDRLGANLDLSPLNGALFEFTSTSDLNELYISNRDLLSALWYLSQYRENDCAPWRRVNYAALDVEELGSVYESLLDFHPVFSNGENRLGFELASGQERKSTGSYYTPRELVEELVDSALVPVLRERVGKVKTDAEKEQALLSLKVCDPACGSGHFLLAAARRLGRELARIRTGEEEPTPEQMRLAVREVITHCIYGVDKNPLAVDLCKVALWIESYAPGKPLTFLDHRIKRGDSLVGVLDLSLIKEGIPDGAFQPVAGDEPAAARALKKRNREERQQLSLSFTPEGRQGGIPEEYRLFLKMRDDTPHQVREKAKLYQALHGGDSGWWRESTASNLWTAAFFAGLTVENDGQKRIVTNSIFFDFLDGHLPDGRTTAFAGALAHENAFFHWPAEFPEVFAQGGFDVVLCNPPWERIKLQEEEFFATRDPEIANALNRAARQRLIRELPTTNPSLWTEYQEAKHNAEALSKFMRGSGRFPLTAHGDINTYSVFAELFSQVIRPAGRAGIVLPTGIATDDTNKQFFAHTVETGRLVSLYDFENREKIFPSVDSRYKFCLLTLRGKGEETKPQQFGFFLTRTEHLRDERRVFTLNGDDFALLNPNTRTCPVFRTRADAEITKKIYQRVPVLINEQTGENLWGIKFGTMFHMSNDSHLFRTTGELEEEGYILSRGCDLGRPDGLYFVRGNEVWLPLYEAKMIWQFDHRFGTYKGVDDRSSTHLPTPTVQDYANPDFLVEPWYWVPEQEVHFRVSRVPKVIVEFYRLGQEKELMQCFALWMAGYYLSQGVPGDDIAHFILQRISSSVFQTVRQDLINYLGNIAAAQAWQRDYPLTENDLEIIYVYADREDIIGMTKAIIEQRCPRWLVGFRDVTNATNERTAIFSVLPSVGVGHTLPIMFFTNMPAFIILTILANFGSLTFDYATRQKIGGTHLTYSCLKQLPVLPPTAYTDTDLFFIVPRVLELVYTSWDLKPFADDVWRECSPELRKEIVRHYWDEAYGNDPQFRLSAESIPPFTWSEDRRTQVRAELDAYYTHLYGLTRDELRYILDPKDVYGEDFPSETFRVLKEKETRQFGEYRTRRLVLAAWDRLFEKE